MTSDHWPEAALDWVIDYWVGWPIDASKRLPVWGRLVMVLPCLLWIVVAILSALPVMVALLALDIPLILWDEMQ